MMQLHCLKVGLVLIPLAKSQGSADYSVSQRDLYFCFYGSFAKQTVVRLPPRKPPLLRKLRPPLSQFEQIKNPRWSLQKWLLFFPDVFSSLPFLSRCLLWYFSSLCEAHYFCSLAQGHSQPDYFVAETCLVYWIFSIRLFVFLEVFIFWSYFVTEMALLPSIFFEYPLAIGLALKITKHNAC